MPGSGGPRREVEDGGAEEERLRIAVRHVGPGEVGRGRDRQEEECEGGRSPPENLAQEEEEDEKRQTPGEEWRDRDRGARDSEDLHCRDVHVTLESPDSHVGVEDAELPSEDVQSAQPREQGVRVRDEFVRRERVEQSNRRSRDEPDERGGADPVEPRAEERQVAAARLGDRHLRDAARPKAEMDRLFHDPHSRPGGPDQDLGEEREIVVRIAREPAEGVGAIEAVSGALVQDVDVEERRDHLVHDGARGALPERNALRARSLDESGSHEDVGAPRFAGLPRAGAARPGRGSGRRPSSPRRRRRGRRPRSRAGTPRRGRSELRRRGSGFGRAPARAPRGSPGSRRVPRPRRSFRGRSRGGRAGRGRVGGSGPRCCPARRKRR
jgi:hypothetical protein